jgi:hypothetical protein
MPFTVQVDKRRKLVSITFRGKVDQAELMQPPGVVSAHPDFDPSFSEIVDFSQVAEADFPVALVQRMAREPSIYAPASRHAVVAPIAHIFGLVRMFQVLAEETRPNLAVVRTVAEAYEFLGIAPPEQ